MVGTILVFKTPYATNIPLINSEMYNTAAK